MSIKKLPETITKEALLKKALDRFQSWVTMCNDPGYTAQNMYEEMSCSMVSGDPAFDFPNEKQDDTIRYQYKYGNCYFIIDGIRVDVFNMHSMRQLQPLKKDAYIDVCVPCISYKDETGYFMYHPIPGTWLYNSTPDDFNEGNAVQRYFIYSAQDFIKEHHITKEMQEVDDDDCI